VRHVGNSLASAITQWKMRPAAIQRYGSVLG